MSRPEIEEMQLRGVLLFLFDKGLKPEEAKESICETYGDVLKIRKCRWWYKKFKNGDRKLENKPKSGRPQKIDDEVLKSLVESDPRKTIKELSQDIGCPWSTVKDHLKRLGKKHRQGVWVPHDLSHDLS